MFLKQQINTRVDEKISRKSVSFDAMPASRSTLRSRNNTLTPATTTRRNNKGKDPIPEYQDKDEILEETSTAKESDEIPKLKSILIHRSESAEKLTPRFRDASKETIREPDAENSFSDDESSPSRIRRGASVTAENKRESTSEVLTKLGFIPRSVLRTNDDKGYVKTMNPAGSSIYVRIDDPNLDLPTELSEISVKKSDIEFIPQSLKIQAKDLMLPDVVGAIVDCSDGLCIIEPKSEGDYRYVLATGLTNYDSVRIIPIVLLSEIRKNKHDIVTTTDRVLTRIIKSLQKACFEDLDMYEAQYKALEETSQEFFKNQDDILAELITQNGNLKAKIKQYISKNPVAWDENYEYIRNELGRNEERIYEIMKYTAQLGNKAMAIQDINNHITALNTILITDFADMRSTN